MPRKKPPKDPHVQQRRVKAMELLRSGWSYERIYHRDDMDYSSVQHVRTDVHRALQEFKKPAQEYVDLQTARMEGLMETFYVRARAQGDPKAADAAFKAHDRITALHGLNRADRGNADHSDVETWLTAMSGGADDDPATDG